MKTLNEFKNNFIDNSVDLKKIKLKDLSSFMINHKDNLKVRNPIDYALDFYLLNHMKYTIQEKFSDNQRLPNDYIQLLSLYIERNSEIYISLFIYILTIITRELRYAIVDANRKIHLSSEFFKFLFYFTERYSKNNPAYSAKFILMEKENLPDISLFNFVKDIKTAYETDMWTEEYGGWAWSYIAKTLLDHINGDLTPEEFCDRAWSLCHNCDIIFNKSIIFPLVIQVIF